MDRWAPTTCAQQHFEPPQSGCTFPDSVLPESLRACKPNRSPWPPVSRPPAGGQVPRDTQQRMKGGKGGGLQGTHKGVLESQTSFLSLMCTPIRHSRQKSDHTCRVCVHAHQGTSYCWLVGHKRDQGPGASMMQTLSVSWWPSMFEVSQHRRLRLWRLRRRLQGRRQVHAGRRVGNCMSRRSMSQGHGIIRMVSAPMLIEEREQL